MGYIGNNSVVQQFTPGADRFSGDGSTVAFTLSRPVGSVYDIQVSVDNVLQDPYTAYSVNNQTLTFTGTPPSGSYNIQVVYRSLITQNIKPGAGTVTTDSFSNQAIQNVAIGSTTASTGAFTTLSASGAFSANGGATLGDASGDALTINSSAVSIPNGLNFGSNTLVLSSGQVAIGTTIGTTFVYMTNANANLILGYNNTSVNYYDADTQIFRSVAGSERMRITSTGNVGIGTSSPVSKLNIYTTDASSKITLSDSTVGTGYGGMIYGYGVAGTGGYMDIGVLDGSAGFTKGIRVTQQATSVRFFTGTNSAGNTERMVIDSSGNLGLGVTPSDIDSSTRTIQMGTNGTAYLENYNGITSNIGFNLYRSSTGFLYKTTNTASIFSQNQNGGFYWYTVPLGTAGTAATLTQAMTLDASGNLLVGTTSVGEKLTVAGNIGAFASGASTDNYLTLQSTNSNSSASGLVKISANSEGSAGTNSAMLFYTRNSAGTIAEKMRIDSSGNVGIGTTAPGAKLDVQTAYDRGFWIEGSASSTVYARATQGGTSNNLRPLGMKSEYLVFETGASTGTTATERMRIDSSGNVGIGTTSPGGKLEVKGNFEGYYSLVLNGTYGTGRSFGFRTHGTDSDALALYDVTGTRIMMMYNATSQYVATYTSGSERMRITSAGNVGIGVTSPGNKMAFPNNTYIGWQDSGGSSESIYIGANSSNVLHIASSPGTNLGQIAFTTGGSERARIDNTGLFQFNSGYGSVATAYGCRAWVCWNGTGTPAIRASGNVSSITDNGTGDFTVNFTTALPDTNFGTSGMTCNDVVGGSSQCVITEKDTGVRSTSSVRVYTGIGTGRYDFPYNSVSIHR